MRTVARVVASAAAYLCLLAAASAGTPAAAESGSAAGPVTGQTATMLAAISAPVATARTAGRPDISSSVPPIAQGRDATVGDTAKPATLAALVEKRLTPDTRDDEHECLATTVYFEAKGQPLDGQLAVAETILNRAGSGRFPGSACGVVKQRGQFGFVRHGSFPGVARASRAWREAVAIAAVARDRLWRAVAANALYFNTGRAPSTGLTQVARFGAQIFYR